MTHPHEHVDERGMLHKCYHSCKSTLASWQFWLGMTLGFPVEHALWEKVWPFKLLAHWMGL